MERCSITNCLNKQAQPCLLRRAGPRESMIVLNWGSEVPPHPGPLPQGEGELCTVSLPLDRARIFAALGVSNELPHVGFAAANVRNCNAHRWRLHLPKGEGRGEGEGIRANLAHTLTQS